MFFHLLVVAVLVGICASASKDQCPTALRRDIYLQVKDNFCYHFELSNERTYNLAQQDCEKDGGNLVTVASQTMNDFIAGQLKNYYSFSGGKDVWIGLNDKNSEGTFEWEDGTKSDFLNWGDDEGQDTGVVHNTEDCVAMSVADGKWHDYSCAGNLLLVLTSSATHPYICQYPISAS